MNTTEDTNAPTKDLDVKSAYEAYSTGKSTINDIADAHNLRAQVVVEAFEQHVQATRPKNKDK